MRLSGATPFSKDLGKPFISQPLGSFNKCMKKVQKKWGGKKQVLRHKIVLKELSENIRNGMTMEQAQINAGYSESYAKTGMLKATKSWQELLEQELPDSLLLKTHKGLINDRKNWKARDQGLDKAYKLKKRYDDTITIKGKFAGLSDSELEARLAGIVSGVKRTVAGKGEKSER